jgi:hypothetical protein
VVPVYRRKILRIGTIIKGRKKLIENESNKFISIKEKNNTKIYISTNFHTKRFTKIIKIHKNKENNNNNK